ncbi:hypothetical protein F5B19DRAFT_396217 [Rostrohypoxylon terebratum]|nr:hypothetical protein F5B19DRAFT_396217 [Rostrohypoxylon terebratum]
MELPWALPVWCNASLSIYLLATLVRSFIWTKSILRSKSQRGISFPGYIVVVFIWITVYTALFFSTPFYIPYYGCWKKLRGILTNATWSRRQPLYKAPDLESGLQSEDTTCRGWSGASLSTMRKRIFTRDTYHSQTSGDIRPIESHSWFVWKKTGSFQTPVSKNQWA